MQYYCSTWYILLYVGVDTGLPWSSYTIVSGGERSVKGSNPGLRLDNLRCVLNPVIKLLVALPKVLMEN